MIYCIRCQTGKPRDEFYKSRISKSGGGWCKACCAEYQRGYYKANVEKIKGYQRQYGAEWAKGNKDKRRAWEYGIPLGRARELLSVCECSICGVSLVKGGRSPDSHVIDHDHDTGLVRGVVCRACNSGLGMFNDSPAALRAAAEYLERHAASAANEPERVDDDPDSVISTAQ